jgi:signal transduction histidine kinase
LEERDRISKELHDGVIQSIYSVGLSLQGSMSLLDRDPDIAKERIDSAIAELDNVVRDVRSYIFALQPKAVEERGLPAAISELARDLEVNTLASVSVELDDEACSSFDETQKTDVIQIVREILSNIARHSRANEVTIRCSEGDTSVLLEIEDDGVGFDPQTVLRGHGLTNMEARAKRLGGEVQIAERKPRGTRHAVSIRREKKD